MIRVLVADDEPLMAAGIRTVLESAPDIEVVAEAGDGRAAVDAALRHRVDVALLDIRMPGMDGLAALAELRRRLPALRVVILTSFGAEPNVHRALAAGASGFVLKNCAPDELIRAVRAVHDGDGDGDAIQQYVFQRVSGDQAHHERDAHDRQRGLEQHTA